MTHTALTAQAATPALPGQTAADPGLIAETVADINATIDRGGLATMRAVATILLDKMFRDEVGHFLTTADVHASYLALAADPDLNISKAGLWYAVAIEENFRLFGDIAPQLGVSQHRRLVHVPDAAARTALAEQSVAEHWTVTDLEQAIDASKGQRPADAPRLGRPPLPAPVKRFGSVRRAIAKLSKDAIGELGDDETAALLTEAEAAQAVLASWIEGLRAALPRSDGDG